MNKDELLLLFQYNAWLTAKIVEAARQVSAEQFLAPVLFPHGSLRGTLVHALFAEWVWRKRWEGSPQNPVWRADEFPDFATLQARWVSQEERLMNFVSGLTEEGLRSKFHYVSTEGKPHERLVWESMLHLVNHGTQHKTEAAAILTGFDHSPGDIDLIVFLNESK